jgi:hypothetical protein
MNTMKSVFWGGKDCIFRPHAAEIKGLNGKEPTDFDLKWRILKDGRKSKRKELISELRLAAR